MCLLQPSQLYLNYSVSYNLPFLRAEVATVFSAS